MAKLMFRDDQGFELGRHRGRGRKGRWEGKDKGLPVEQDDSETEARQ